MKFYKLDFYHSVTVIKETSGIVVELIEILDIILLF